MTKPLPGLLLVAQAADFAARAHVGQRRKGVNAEPYVNHVAEVAFLLAQGGAGPELIAAGWLHDVVEDTDHRLSEIEQQFGAEVAAIVAQVTDDKSLPKAARKQAQVDEMPNKSEAAQLLKFADKTSNLHDLARSPPDGWDRERLEGYIAWGESVIGRATAKNAFLENAFREAVAKAREAAAARLGGKEAVEISA